MRAHAHTRTDKHVYYPLRYKDRARNLEDVCELGVAEGHMGRARGQRMNAIPESTQALVDELGFPEPLPLGLSLTHPLTPCQIHQPQLGPPHIPCTHAHTHCRHLKRRSAQSVYRNVVSLC